MIGFAEISRFLGRFFFYFSLILLIPLFVALFYDFYLEKDLVHVQSSQAFFWTFLSCTLLASLFWVFGRNGKGTIERRESIFLVGIIWFLTAAVASLPFVFSKTLDSPLDAYFETMSGLTTTGATVFSSVTIQPLTDPATNHVIATGIEAVAKPLLFWRSFLQWLGGMGIILLFIAILPALSMGGRFLFEAEMTGPNKEAVMPRIRETASLLWKIYLGLTLIEVFLLLLTNPSLPFFDALTLSFSTLSTGGFSVKNAGISAYNSLATEGIVSLFMILGSINFILYFHCLKGKIYRIYEPEFFAFFGILLTGCMVVSLSLTQVLPWKEAFRQGFFQAISGQTSTGFSVASDSLWPIYSQFLVLLLMFVGGMSGSTTGGVKVARLMIFFRVIAHKIESVFRPASVRCLKIGSKEISEKSALTVLIYLCIFILLTALGAFLLILDGIDGTTALGVVSSMINNAGLSFGTATLDQSHAFLPPLSKFVCILSMALGRLELFILLAFLVPAFWRRA